MDELIVQPINAGGGIISHMYPFLFYKRQDVTALGAEADAGVERIDGTDYFFGDVDAALASLRGDPDFALKVCRAYLEGLPKRDER